MMVDDGREKEESHEVCRNASIDEKYKVFLIGVTWNERKWFLAFRGFGSCIDRSSARVAIYSYVQKILAGYGPRWRSECLVTHVSLKRNFSCAYLDGEYSWGLNGKRIELKAFLWKLCTMNMRENVNIYHANDGICFPMNEGYFSSLATIWSNFRISIKTIATFAIEISFVRRYFYSETLGESCFNVRKYFWSSFFEICLLEFHQTHWVSDDRAEDFSPEFKAEFTPENIREMHSKLLSKTKASVDNWWNFRG